MTCNLKFQLFKHPGSFGSFALFGVGFLFQGLYHLDVKQVNCELCVV